MKDKGWIKLHRKIFNSVVYQDSKLLHLWIHCLLKANHKSNEFLFNGEKMTVKKGQFISGRFELAKELNMKSSSVYRRLKILEKLQKVNIKSNNKFSLITVIKYSTYQQRIEEGEQQDEQQVNNKRTTSEQQVNTNKNVKNDKNEKKEQGEKVIWENPSPYFTVEHCISTAEYEGYSKEEGQKFFDFYNSQGWKRGKSQALITDLVSAFRAWISRAGEMGITPSKAGKLNQTNL